MLTLATVVPVAAQQDAAAWERLCGERPQAIDDHVQERIESGLSLQLPQWELKRATTPMPMNARGLQLTHDGVRVGVDIEYWHSREDAAKHLRCQLMLISMPVYKPLSGIGDEAYVMTTSHLRFRSGSLVFSVDSRDGSLETERRVAEGLIRAVQRK